MAKEDLTCNKCGATLSRLESEPDTYICLHCGNKQIILPEQTTINNNYQVNQNITKYIYGNDRPEFAELIAKAETYYRLSDYQAALNLFEQATQENPADYQGWWGKTRCKIFTKNLNDCHQDYLRACELADANTERQITMEYEKLRPSLSQQINYTDRNFSYRAELSKNRNENHRMLRLVLTLLGSVGSILAIISYYYLLTSNIEDPPLLVILLGVGLVGIVPSFVISISLLHWKFKIIDFIKSKERISLSDLCQLYPAIFRNNLKNTTRYVVNLIKNGYLYGYEIKNSVIQRVTQN